MQIYRNYDGHASTFGDSSAYAGVANPDYLSAFAAVRSTDGALTVMVINKQQGSTPVSVSLANFATTGTAQAWQISSASQTAITALGSVPIANNSIGTTLPPQSITLFVIAPGSITSVPGAPTGLAAAVGNGTVHLTWQATGGATSYTIGRGIAIGGPFPKAGTVTSPAPTSFRDSGLTNGTTYYYVVSGTNGAGTGSNSAPVAATPLAPPTFTSSATASPNPVAQGASTTVTANVTCTSHSLSNGIVQVMVIDPSGNTAALQNFTGQNFAKNQSRSYTVTVQPAVAGAYTVEIGVFSSTWQLWNWNSSAGTITVTSSLTFTASASANPATISTTGTSNISATVTDTGTAGLTNAIVELQVFNQSGSAVATTYWTGQNFNGGQSHPYSYTWSPAGGVPPGSYSVDIGVFNSDWTYNYYWSGTAATITVTQ
jgi:hypothetical protein